MSDEKPKGAAGWFSGNAIQLISYIIATIVFLIVMRESTITNARDIATLEERSERMMADLRAISDSVQRTTATLDQIERRLGRAEDHIDRIRDNGP